MPLQPALVLVGESVIEDGVAGKRARKVTALPRAMERVALYVLVPSMPRRPISRTEPVISNPELTVLLMGKRQVRAHVVKVVVPVPSCISWKSARENEKPPAKKALASRCHALPVQAALSVNQIA